MQSHPCSPSHPLSPQATGKPFLKWTGGKQRLLGQLLEHLPPGKRLVEPFLGAGSVFLGTQYPKYLLGDANLDLIAVWAALQARPREYMSQAASFFREEYRLQEQYLWLRHRFRGETDSFARAVLMPYLNRFGFNGLYRVNSKGLYNVPYGKPARVPNFPWDEMAVASEKLQSAKLHAGGYEALLNQAGEGDVVYCDPPYADVGKASFTGYTANGFGPTEQQTLVRLAEEAVHRGAKVLVSNHDTAFTRELYRGWEQVELNVRRSVSGKAEVRGVERELLAVKKP